MSQARPRFSRAALLAGARVSLPLQVGLLPFALVVGVVAQGQQLSLTEAVLMSATCFAGSAQLLALGHWGHPAPVLAAATTALIVNLRLALMGPVLGPWLDRLRGWRLWASLFLMADQNWALAVQEMRRGRSDAAYLMGCGAVTWVVWVAGTAAGHLLGAQVRPPAGHPLFFAALAVFVAVLTSLWRGRADLLPWVVAASVSLGVARLVEGSWYIVAGALAGVAAGLLRDRMRSPV